MREEVSHCHGTRVLFLPGNLVRASPYTEAFFEYLLERLFHPEA
jgi:hypothetical protein